MLKKLTLGLAATMAISGTAMARGGNGGGIVFSPNLGYYSDTQKSGGNKSERSATTIDLRLGYVLSQGIYLGALYGMMNEKSGATDWKTSGFGPTLGYVNSGFSALLTYHLLMADWDLGGTPNTKYTEGKGFQFDISYAFPLASNFSMGPSLTYKSIKYDKVESGGAKTSSDMTRTWIAPTVNIWFTF